jgi:hypothetical protein
MGALLQDLGDALADAKRRLLRLLARPPRQRLGVVEEDEVDVGRIIELAPAELAEAEDREAARRRVRRALCDRGGQRPRDQPVGEIGQRLQQFAQGNLAAEVGEAEREGIAGADPAHRPHHLLAALVGLRQRRGKPLRGQLFSDLRQQLELHGEERRMRPRPWNNVVKIHETYRLIPATVTPPVRSGGATFETGEVNIR